MIPGIQNPFDPLEADITGDDGQVGGDRVADGAGDFDGDGVSNAQEFIDGTNPTNEISFGTRFPVEVIRENNSISLDWESEPGYSYEVQMSIDLKGWSSFAGPIFRTWSQNNPTRYFRVVREKL